MQDLYFKIIDENDNEILGTMGYEKCATNDKVKDILKKLNQEEHLNMVKNIYSNTGNVKIEAISKEEYEKYSESL